MTPPISLKKPLLHSSEHHGVAPACNQTSGDHMSSSRFGRRGSADHNLINQAKRTGFALLCAFAILAICSLAGCSCSSQNNTNSHPGEPASTFASEPAEKTLPKPSEAASSSSSASSSAAPIPNPINFDELTEQNPDVYAWINLPDSNVDLPILQHPLADNYYLVHDINDAESAYGAIYTQFVNKLDFSDPVTVIYGHTYEEWSDLKDEMFSTLHLLENQDFFDSHPYFYIYTPDRMLTYQIVSAYEYDDRHIMNSFDFSDKKILQEYFDYIVNPDSLVKNVRKGIHLEAGKDKVVQLSTCTRPANDSARYIVTGVLIDSKSLGA
ncbi:MAG: class B sortase [Eggerthellaceae bacterium]|nr:class B sortase [Eggerthellaceae bacterium]